jgi:hypothetical protein
VLSQTFEDFAVVVSDNASTDGTGPLVTDLALRDPRVRYHRFPTNRGPADNWKYVIDAADTEFVALLPDDDIWCKDHLQVAVAALRRHPDATLYCCRAEWFGNRTGVLVGPPWLVEACGLTIHDARHDALPWLGGNPVATASVVYRREAACGIDHSADDRFGCGDWLLWGRLALEGKLLFDPTVRVRYRWHASNDSLTALRGRRLAAQQRFVIRVLAAQAMRQSALDLSALVREVSERWPEPEAAGVVVALGSFDSPPALRHAAVAAFTARSRGRGWTGSRHCLLAARLGTWYLAVADPVDRLRGLWWRPRRRR